MEEVDEEDGVKVEMEDGDVIEEEEEEEAVEDDDEEEEEEEEDVAEDEEDEEDEGLTMNREVADVGWSILTMGARS